MTLGEKQELFSRMLPLLILYAQFLGYQIRCGDTFRDKRVHGDFGEKKGYSSKWSVHKLKLASDLYLTEDGVFLRGEAANKAHSKLHDFWDLLGGAQRIEGDLNHYSLEHNGYR
ncbi:MAG: M15 family peptidase [Gammaproteobacteria bacterium]|nr:M15 family peptidase [Gammaproteobacteria bacterium]